MIAETTELDPYVGPRPFGRTEEDQARFFGRHRETEEIVSLIVSHPVLLVYAQSGAGKTSLFEAQVAPALETKGFQVLPLARVRAAIPDGLDPADVRNIYVFAALLGITPQDEPGEPDAESLAASSLDAYLKAHAPDRSARRCIVFDQFEEIFTDESVFALRPTRWQEEQEGFFRQVKQAITKDPLLRVVFVMRKEHLAELDRFVNLLPEGLRTRFHLEPLGRKAALSAVTLPVRNTSRSFEDGVPEELVEKLLMMRVDVGGGEIKQVPGRFVEPLHLQLVCQRIWEELGPDDTVITKEHLRALGDVDVVLGELYDAAVREASAAGRISEKRLRRRIESDFITPAGTRGIVFVGETPDEAGFRQSVHELESQHLIRAEWRAGADWYELTHDRLIEPVRESNARYRAAKARKKRPWLAVGLAIAIAGGIAAGVLLAGTDGDYKLTPIARLPDVGQSALESLSSVAFSPDGRLVVTAGSDGEARVWYWPKAKIIARLRVRKPAPLLSAAFSPDPDGKLVVTAGADGQAQVWNWREKKIGARLRVRNPAPLSSAVFSPDGRLVVTAGADGTARVWDWYSTTEWVVLSASQQAALSSAAFSPDGKLVVTAGADGAARVWDWYSTTELVVLSASQQAALSSAAFSPDGKLVVTAGADGAARVWEWRSKRVEAELMQSDRVTSAVFSNLRDKFVVTAGADGAARVWEWRSGKDPVVLNTSQQALLSAALSPVGSLVMTAGRDGFARIYGAEQVSS